MYTNFNQLLNLLEKKREIRPNIKSYEATLSNMQLSMIFIFNQFESLKQKNPSLDNSGQLTSCQKQACQYYEEIRKLINDKKSASKPKADQLVVKEALLICSLLEAKNLDTSIIKMKVEFVLN